MSNLPHKSIDGQGGNVLRPCPHCREILDLPVGYKCTCEFIYGNRLAAYRVYAQTQQDLPSVLYGATPEPFKEIVEEVSPSSTARALVFAILVAPVVFFVGVAFLSFLLERH